MTVRSLYVGLTGLNAMSHNIDVIGNNITNVNTVGFRASRASFDDIFYTTMFSGAGATGNRGGINPRQTGLGVKLGSIDTIFTQGNTQNTGRLMDMAIQGKGFFVLQNGAGQEFLTRAGNFSIDNQGFIVDPGTGYRLVGRQADENGQLLDTEAPGAMAVDFNRKSLAKQTENVAAAGNFDKRIGDPNEDSAVAQAQKTTNLLGLFDNVGQPFGLINGDVIKFETGYLELSDPPNNVQSPIDLTTMDIGKGDGVIMSVTSSTTVADMEKALNTYFTSVIQELDPTASSGMKITYDATSGNFEFNNFGSNALKGLRVGVAPRLDSSRPPEDANRAVGNLFVNEGDPNFTKTLDVDADSVVNTNSMRRADLTTSIDVFDSQGASHTITAGLAADTASPPAEALTQIGKLRDSEGRMMIPGGVVPPKPVFSKPIIDSSTDTAVFTASQISNMMITQGVFSFNDGSGNMVSLRLSDGAISFNGGAFNQPVQADGTINTEFSNAGVDVTGDSFLNIPSVNNAGGGLLGDEGFSNKTTLEDIRSNIETRINGAIRQVASNLDQIDPNGTLTNVPAAGLTAITNIPSISVNLTSEGALSFKANGGNLGASTSSDATVTSNLASAAGGADQLGLVVDLAARTRTVRVSTIDPRGTLADATDDIADHQVDEDFTDGGGITGFISSADPFAATLSDAFSIGNTDFGLFDDTGNPTASPPTGVDDSGVQLVALSSGVLSTNDALTAQNFSGFQAFTPEVTALRALFNQRGYGVASNFDGTAGIDRSANVPVGVVAKSTDTLPFETNVLQKDGITRSTVNYQIVTPSDNRTLPTQTTGEMIFDSSGRFQSYGAGGDTAPNITFDPDNSDPANGGVDPIAFKMDLSGITYFSSNGTAQLQSQDGRPVGNLDNISIAGNGEILGVFTNGDTQTLGKIILADVTNEGGLIQEGATLFTVGPNSGQRFFIEPETEGGVINSGTLELSNVDLAKEFTDLIVAQRGYQASTRIITTGDQVIQEALRLKQ
ncbi:MAG: flagellar hook-basal body complex protein [bacterium]|nr:flagellar hook-basal body complex protein [bacterium]